MKKGTKYYQEESVGKLIYPLKTFYIPEKDLIIVYQEFALNLSPQKFYHELIIFNKLNGELQYKFSNHKYSINDVLFIEPEKLLLSCGDYDGGQNYFGELLLMNLSEYTIKTLYKGRYFDKCKYNENTEIEVTVFPYEDDSFSPPELYVDTTYKLDSLDYIEAIEELEVIKQEKHQEKFQRFDKWISLSIDELKKCLKPKVKFQRAGSIRHLALFENHGSQMIVSTIDNIGIQIINTIPQRVYFKIREGLFRQLQILGDLIFVTYCESYIYEDENNKLIKYCKKNQKCEVIYKGEFSSFSIDINQNILILNNQYKPDRKYDYLFITSTGILKGNFSEKDVNYYAVTTNDKKYLYFMESDCQYPKSILKLNRFENLNSKEVWYTKKFIASYNSESYFVVDNTYLVFHGRLSSEESTESLMYGLIIVDFHSQEEISIVKNKEHYYQINVDYDEMKIYCLTSNYEVEVYKILTGKLIDIIDLKEFTDEIVLSINAASGKLIIGTVYGTVIQLNLREITSCNHDHAS